MPRAAQRERAPPKIPKKPATSPAMLICIGFFLQKMKGACPESKRLCLSISIIMGKAVVKPFLWARVEKKARFVYNMPMEKVPELLAPAGDAEIAKLALRAGADAVYIGGKWSARAYAKNATEEELESLLAYAHIKGKKVYVALNTMLFERELEGALSYAGFLYDAGADAVIAADLGFMRLARREYPALPLHASTQAGVQEAGGAAFFAALGCRRVIAARETSFAGLREMCAAGVEVEAFCHGAMCSGVSGVCLMSGMIGGRSGNRGRCAQPCRKKYLLGESLAYHLSMKDLCTLGVLRDLMDTGVCALKIEGRMKSAAYVAGTVDAYRRGMDAVFSGAAFDPEAEAEQLKRLFNRGGFSRGYYPGAGDMTYTLRPDHLGVYVGRVEKVEKGRATVAAKEEVRAGDGLEAGGAGFSVKSVERRGEKLLLEAPPGVKAGDAVYLRSDSALTWRLAEAFAEEGVPLRMVLAAEAEKETILTLSARGIQVRVTSAATEPSKKPISAARVEENLKKTGGTLFYAESCKAELTGAPFLADSYVNALRREGIRALTEALSGRRSGGAGRESGENGTDEARLTEGEGTPQVSNDETKPGGDKENAGKAVQSAASLVVGEIAGSGAVLPGEGREGRKSFAATAAGATGGASLTAEQREEFFTDGQESPDAAGFARPSGQDSPDEAKLSRPSEHPRYIAVETDSGKISGAGGEAKHMSGGTAESRPDEGRSIAAGAAGGAFLTAEQREEFFTDGQENPEGAGFARPSGQVPSNAAKMDSREISGANGEIRHMPGGMAESRPDESRYIAVETDSAKTARLALEAGADRVYFVYHKESCPGENIWLALPPYLSAAEGERYEKEYRKGYAGILAGSPGGLALAQRLRAPCVADYTLNIANNAAFAAAGAEGYVPSCELSLKDVNALSGAKELFVYGRQALMSFRHCPVKKELGCGACGGFLKDEAGYAFPLKRRGMGECLLVLYNSVPMGFTGLKELKGVLGLRLSFLAMEEEEPGAVIQKYAKAWKEGEALCRFSGFNNGQLYRGVE